jgi:hypothetical protein
MCANRFVQNPFKYPVSCTSQWVTHFAHCNFCDCKLAGATNGLQHKCSTGTKQCCNSQGTFSQSCNTILNQISLKNLNIGVMVHRQHLKRLNSKPLLLTFSRAFWIMVRQQLQVLRRQCFAKFRLPKSHQYSLHYRKSK